MSQNNMSHAQKVVRDILMLRALNDQNLEECGETHMENDSEEDDLDTSSPVMDRFINECGVVSVREMTGLTYREFNLIYDPMEVELNAEWFAGRGRKMTVSPKDAFFMMLSVFHTYASWDHHALDFRMSSSQLQKTVSKIMYLVEPILTKRLITPYSMTELNEAGTLFNYFPYALYATDVKFQQGNRPSGSHLESKTHYSQKHKLYGFKLECSVAPNGQCVYIADHAVGSENDLTIFRNNIGAHQTLLKKKNTEQDINDHGELWDRYVEYWATLVDKGYQGLGVDIRALHPKKKPRKGRLERADLDRNRNLSSDCVIVE